MYIVVSSLARDCTLAELVVEKEKNERKSCVSGARGVMAIVKRVPVHISARRSKTIVYVGNN